MLLARVLLSCTLAVLPRPVATSSETELRRRVESVEKGAPLHKIKEVLGEPRGLDVTSDGHLEVYFLLSKRQDARETWIGVDCVLSADGRLVESAINQSGVIQWISCEQFHRLKKGLVTRICG
jgi:hypothetical protein